MGVNSLMGFLGMNGRNFTVQAVGRYLQVMKQLLEVYPDPLVIDPTPFAVDTFRCRFRDASRGLIHYRYKVDIDIDEYEEVFKNISISPIDDGKLIIGTRAKIKDHKPKEPMMKAVVEGVISDADSEDIEALTRLMFRGHISECRVQPFTSTLEEKLLELVTKYDLGYTIQNGVYIIYE